MRTSSLREPMRAAPFHTGGIDDEETVDPAGDTMPPPGLQAAPGRADEPPVPEWLRWGTRARPAGVEAAAAAMHAAAIEAGADHHAASDLSGNVCAILATDRELGLPADPWAVAIEATRRRRMSDALAGALAAVWLRFFPPDP